MTATNEAAQAMDLQQIRYSMVWEDHELLAKGLQIQPDDHLLAIISGGNNVLSMLLREPAKITAVDFSPAQIALFDLKIAGIKELSYEQFIDLMGFTTPAKAKAALECLLPHRNSQTIDFWSKNINIVEDGIFRCGRLDGYFEVFRRDTIQRYWNDELISLLFNVQDLDEQARLFRENTPDAFRDAFVAYYGQESMAKRGRDPAQFKYVEHDDVGEFFWERFWYACTELPLHGNFYLERFITGTHADLELGPEYLRRANFERLKDLVDRVDYQHAELEQVLADNPPDTFSKAMLSDVFEYLSPEASDELFRLLARGLRPGGRVAYWNLLVPRTPPKNVNLKQLTSSSEELWRQDRAWFYRDFWVDEVQP